jgi:hypothetical protein
MSSEAKDDGTRGGGSAAADWENRRLCSDESCIGVIGPDGRCKECGRPYAGEDGAAAADVPPVSAPAPAAGEQPGPSGANGPEEADTDWESRRLCSDESCIGVIGPDGRCKECGRPFSG